MSLIGGPTCTYYFGSTLSSGYNNIACVASFFGNIDPTFDKFINAQTTCSNDVSTPCYSNVPNQDCSKCYKDSLESPISELISSISDSICKCP